MKKLMMLLMPILAGCADRTPIQPIDVSHLYVLPKILIEKGCTIHEVDAQAMPTLYITYCPNSQVTTSYMEKSGKTNIERSNVVIDGVEYEPKPE